MVVDTERGAPAKRLLVPQQQTYAARRLLRSQEKECELIEAKFS